MSGERIGPFRVLRPIASGGMAEIYLATRAGDNDFEHYVAVKVIHRDYAGRDEFVQMLVDEARIAMKLSHPNIARTYELGRLPDGFYIAMEFVDGANLYELLCRAARARRQFPIEVAATIAREVALGLDHAHNKRDARGTPLNIIHRDVSPQNVLISRAGQTKLVDFGIAKASFSSTKTQFGVLKGKYRYMSPEQAQGKRVDRRTDVFSTGILLFEMLTGRVLYGEEDLYKLLDCARQANIPRPARFRADVPPELEQIVLRALARSPQERYSTCADLATDLTRFLGKFGRPCTASSLALFFAELFGKPATRGSAPRPRMEVLVSKKPRDDRPLPVSGEIDDDQPTILADGEDEQDGMTTVAVRAATSSPPTVLPPSLASYDDDEPTFVLLGAKAKVSVWR